MMCAYLGVFNDNFHITGFVFGSQLFCDHIWVKKWTMMPETEGKAGCNITSCKEFRFGTAL